MELLKFAELERKLAKSAMTPINYLAPKLGNVYVITITRDGCSACEREKPKLDMLETDLIEKHGNRIEFKRIHIKHSSDSTCESLQAKDLFHYYFYPTVLVVVRTKDKGAVEFYRNISPEIAELKNNIEHSLELAKVLEKEA